MSDKRITTSLIIRTDRFAYMAHSGLLRKEERDKQQLELALADEIHMAKVSNQNSSTAKRGEPYL